MTITSPLELFVSNQGAFNVSRISCNLCEWLLVHLSECCCQSYKWHICIYGRETNTVKCCYFSFNKNAYEFVLLLKLVVSSPVLFLTTVCVSMLCNVAAVVDWTFKSCYSWRASWCRASSTVEWSFRTWNARFWCMQLYMYHVHQDDFLKTQLTFTFVQYIVFSASESHIVAFCIIFPVPVGFYHNIRTHMLRLFCSILNKL